MAQGRFHNPYFKSTKPTKRFHPDTLAIIGIVILVVGLGWYVFIQRQVLAVKDITVNGNQYLTPDQIKTAANSALEQRHLVVFKQKFLPFLDTTLLAATVQAELNKTVQLDSLVVKKQWPHSIVITVAERVPGYVYINNKQAYYLDVNGKVSSQVDEKASDPHFPHLRERNKKREIAVDQPVLHRSVMQFISDLHGQFTPATSLDISEYAVLPVTCVEKQYVTEEIFADEIAGTADEGVKQQKRDILDQLRNNKITVDQSLDLLADIKNSEETNSNGTAGGEQFVQLATKYETSKCDYAAVIRDVAVVTQQGVEVYFDTSLPIEVQLNNLKQILGDEISKPEALTYIDVRFTDRAYYK